MIYLSTGAWNVAPTLTRFLSRHLYPRGPILLTDWGPTQGRLVPQRAGAQAQPRWCGWRAEFPESAGCSSATTASTTPTCTPTSRAATRTNVAAVAIRHLSPTEQVLASGLPVPMDQAKSVPGTPWISGTDGAALSEPAAPRSACSEPSRGRRRSVDLRLAGLDTAPAPARGLRPWWTC